MCSPVRSVGCVRVFAPACRSLKDDHSIVNKQDICLKSCITSGEDSEEMCCATLSAALRVHVTLVPPQPFHLEPNAYSTILQARKRHTHIISFFSSMSLSLRRHICSNFHQRGSPRPRRHRRPAVSRGHICTAVSSSEWGFAAVAKEPRVPGSDRITRGTPEVQRQRQRTSQIRKRTESTWRAGRKAAGKGGWRESERQTAVPPGQTKEEKKENNQKKKNKNANVFRSEHLFPSASH